MYRVFNWREALPIVRGRYADARLTVPTLLVFGVDDFVLRPQMLAGYQRHADEMRVELVDGCGHFIADERPDLVADRAREFLAPANLSAAVLCGRMRHKGLPRSDQARIRASSRSRSRSIWRIVALRRRSAPRSSSRISRSIPISSRRSSP